MRLLVWIRRQWKQTKRLARALALSHAETIAARDEVKRLRRELAAARDALRDPEEWRMQTHGTCRFNPTGTGCRFGPVNGSEVRWPVRVRPFGPACHRWQANAENGAEEGMR